MHRCYLDFPAGRPPRPGELVPLSAEESKHLLTVLRSEPGAPLVLTDGRGHACEAVLEKSDRRGCLVRVTDVRLVEEETAPPLLHLACAVVKGRRFEVAVEKAVELGAHAITPLLCRRGVIDPREGKLERWRGLAVAALKQSDRCHLPALQPPAEPHSVLAEAAATGAQAWFGAAPIETPQTAPLTLLQAAEGVAAARRAGGAPPPALLLMIGPEGGWSDDELALFARRQAAPLSLGPHVLRTETAAVAGLTVLQQLRGVWQADRARPGPSRPA